MSTAIASPQSGFETLAELVADLGHVPLNRIRLHPPLGTATVRDVEQTKGAELVDGTLVEKAMGATESMLAAFFIQLIRQFVSENRLGVVTGEQGSWQISPGLIRMPDVAFISWDRFPNRRMPDEPCPEVVPDLAIEVISRGNTVPEMNRKRRDYFEAGVRQVWIVDRFNRHVEVWTSLTEMKLLAEADSIDGGDVLPGFQLSVASIFAELERHG